MRWYLTLLLGVLLPIASFGKDRDYPGGNFSIYVPDDWSAPSVLPKGLQAAFISPDRTVTVEILIAHGNGRVVTSEFFDSVREKLSRSFKLNPVHKLSGAKQPMEYMIGVNAKGQEMGTYVAADGKVLYMVRVTSLTGGIETNPQIRAILKSFTVLVPAQIPKNSTPVGGS